MGNEFKDFEMETPSLTLKMESAVAKNHADVPRFSNYIIMPMAYLCNTFFSTEKLPGFVGKFVSDGQKTVSRTKLRKL